MADYRLSGKADDDLNEIYLYSYQRFGESKADDYLLNMERCFIMLANQPRLGRQIDNIRKGYRRLDHGNHAIFYKITDKNIIIMRVLHATRNVLSLLTEEQENSG